MARVTPSPADGTAPRSRGPETRALPLARFTPRGRTIVRARRTPRGVQSFLNGLPYNWERGGRTLRTFRGVVRHGEANCIEAMLAAATILGQHGDPPLVVDLESQDGLDHELFLFHRHGRWGAVARSRDLGLHGRRPVFRTVHDLVMSYVDPYVDGSGRVVGCGVGDLDELVRGDWRLADHNVWAVERALYRMPHRRLRTSDGRYTRMLKRVLAFRETGARSPAGRSVSCTGPARPTGGDPIAPRLR